MSLEYILKVKTDRQTFFMILLNIFTGAASFLGAIEGRWIYFAVYLFLACGTFLHLLYTASTVIQLDHQGIEVSYPFGKYRMEWYEVENIEHAWGHIIIEGRGKMLTIPGPGDWEKSKRDEAKKQIEVLSNITIKKTTSRPIYYIPKWHNTKN